MSVVHIVDYGIGNLYSVARAIERAGGEVRLSDDPAAIRDADRVLLPGVGAFSACATTLRERGLAEPVLEFVATGRPFLGICVGMQLLFDYSLEFGRHEGLGLIPGHVAAIPASDEAGTRKVPHIGWNELQMPTGRRHWNGTLLESARPGESAVYFVHSYHCVPDHPASQLAEVDYQGFRVTAAVALDNITACQFHPEKSGRVGLSIIERFMTI